VTQTILNVIDFQMNAQDAVDAPRIHHQWLPDKLYCEKGVSPDTVALVESPRYDVDFSPGVVLARVEPFGPMAAGSRAARTGAAPGRPRGTRTAAG